MDELQIMQDIFTQQVTLVRDFVNALGVMRLELAENSTAKFPKSTLERAAALVSDIEMRRDELANLEKLQTKTRLQVYLHSILNHTFNDRD